MSLVGTRPILQDVKEAGFRFSVAFRLVNAGGVLVFLNLSKRCSSFPFG